MTAVTPSEVHYSADKTRVTLIVTATAADTVAYADYVHGKSIAAVYGVNVSDTTVLAYTYDGTDITIPSGPSADVCAIVIDMY